MPDQQYVVRLYDGFDGCWIDITDPVPKEEADRVWKEKTANGTKNTRFEDIDYYEVFPANTKMHFHEGNPAAPGR